MNRRVVITGLGVISSIGIGWQEFWKNLLAGKSGVGPVTSFDTSNHFTHYAGEIKDFRPEDFILKDRIRSLSGASQMAIAATKVAVADARLSQRDFSDAQAGVFIGTNIGSVQSVERVNEMIVNTKKNHVDNNMAIQIPTNTTAATIAKDYNLPGVNMSFATACAAGNYAIGYGYDLIKLGRGDVMVVGGSDALSKVAFTGFNQFRAVAPQCCQPFDKNRKGMIVAEAAGILIMESLEHALKRGAPVYAEILGYGLSCDAHHMTTSTVEGISTCMKKAMKQSNITVDDIDYISAHGTGTQTNDKNECAAIKNVFGPRYRNIPGSSIKSMLGHTMGAASALEAIACCLVVKDDVIPPTINFQTSDPECDIDCVPNKPMRRTVNIALNNAYAFGGNNACLVLKKFVDSGGGQDA